MERQQGIHLEMRRRLVAMIVSLGLVGCQGGGSPGTTSSPTPSSSPALAAGASPGASPPTGSGGKTRIKAKKGPAWVLDAMKVVWNDPEHKARVEKVDWTLPEPGGGPGVRVQADGAWFKVEQNSIEFEGQVIATRVKNGDRLVVRRLIWDGKTRRFVGSGGVRWTRGPAELTGDHLKATDDLKHIELEGDVRAETLLDGTL